METGKSTVGHATISHTTELARSQRYRRCLLNDQETDMQSGGGKQ